MELLERDAALAALAGAHADAARGEGRVVFVSGEPGIGKTTLVTRFLRDLGNPFAAVGADSSGRAAIDWGVYGVPETFVVGPDGTIRHKHIGPLQPEQMRSFMDKVRAAGP